MCDFTPLLLSKIDLTSLTTIMAAWFFVNNALPIFEATGAFIILNYKYQPVDHVKNVVTITTADIFSNDGASPPRSFLQPAMTV